MTVNASQQPLHDEAYRISGLAALWELLTFARNPIDFATKSAQEYGDTAILSLGSIEIFLFHHPDLITEVLNTQYQSFIKDVSYRSLSKVLGNGLLLSDGELWRRHRQLMAPAFSQERISAYASIVVEETSHLLSHWKKGDILDIYQEMRQLTVKVIAKALFGIDVTQTALEIGDALEAISLQIYHRAQTNFLLPDWMPTKSNLRANRAIQYLNKIVISIIEQRCQSPKDDLLSTLLSVKDEDGNQLSFEELRDEVMTLLLAGHDTTANALTWTIMLLAQHPTVANQLRKETQTELDGKIPNITFLPRLAYSQMVIRESMRLYSPAWILTREAIQDCQIGPYRLKKGAGVVVSQWVVHRDPRFFADPEKFLPERWQDNFEQTLPRCTYFPFGAGPRVCIGKAFSMMEATLILAMLANQFQFKLVPDQSIELLPSITLRPKQGIKMILD